jgi:hypothetical protein
MPTTPYRALRVVLGVVFVLAAVVGLLMIFSGKSLLIKLFLNPPESEISTLLLGTIKEVGGFALMLSVMLFFAYRDPARNVAIIDARLWVCASLRLHPCSLSTPWISDGCIPTT